MGENQHLAKLIDRFMDAEKVTAGIGVWQAHGNDGEHRIVWPLLVNDEASGHELKVCYHVGRKPLHFSLGVYCPRPIWRLDFDDLKGHTNGFGCPDGLPQTMEGPHVHRWIYNRKLCTANSLPTRLFYAAPLPANIRSFENAFRWACAELKIQFAEVPVPPKPMLIL